MTDNMNGSPPLGTTKHSPLLDYLPLAAFLIAYWAGGLRAATMAIMVATVLVVAVIRYRTGRIAMIHVFTGVIVGITGGLTLWLHDDSFIKMKPTLVYLLFAAILAYGRISGKPLLKLVLGSTLPLDDTGWHRLALRFLFFFLAMAAINEVLRRMLTTDLWVLWKVPGSIIATFAFTLAQLPLMRRHWRPDAPL